MSYGGHSCTACGHEFQRAGRLQAFEIECPKCGHRTPVKTVEPPSKSEGGSSFDGLAFVIGMLLGPVGLWYSRNWAAGFAWLTMAVLLTIAYGHNAAVVCWLGMALHAGLATPRK